MKNILNKIILKLYLTYHSIMINIGLALYRSDNDILKADPNNLNEKDVYRHRILHINPFINRLLQGQKDEKFVKDYYEVLKKSEIFIKKSTPHKYATSADKFSMSYGRENKYGIKHEHYGFYPEGHKYFGKTIAEVEKIEIEERRLKDDDLPILYIFNNQPIVEELSKEIEKIESKDGTGLNTFEKAKVAKFPIKITRKIDVANKIEKLTDFLHVKRIDDDYRYFEFYIPKKYKLSEINEDDKIFKEIITFDEIYIKDQWGTLLGFTVEKYVKRIDANENHEVLKFFGLEQKQTLQ